jgi:phage-related minor tail protein
MGYNSWGLKIGIEGEKQFKNDLKEINRSLKMLGSEMNLVISQFDKQDKSLQAITARNAVLNKEIDAQKEKVGTLERALANAELNKMERELKESQEQVKRLNREKIDNLINGLKKAGDIAGKTLVAGLKAAAAMAAIGTGAVAGS